MPTLSAHELIPAGVALRLRHVYQDINYLAVANGDRDELEAATRQLARRNASKLDSHAALADCCALADYHRAHRGLVIPEDTLPIPDVVPWAYARYRGVPDVEAA